MWTFRQAIRHYERGDLTKGDLFLTLMRIVTAENVSEFRTSIPAGLLREVQVYVGTCPRTEEGWSRLRTFHMGGFTGSAEQYEALLTQERQQHRRGAEILRDVFGPLPYRDVRVPASVLGWNDRCVVKLATGIYEERDFSSQRMGALADALEEAGVTEEVVLGHCRRKGAVHARGCWLIDAILGRG